MGEKIADIGNVREEASALDQAVRLLNASDATASKIISP
jgi:hypothetical protein